MLAENDLNSIKITEIGPRVDLMKVITAKTLKEICGRKKLDMRTTPKRKTEKPFSKVQQFL